MTKTARRPDGDLPEALAELADAIAALVEPKIEWLDGRVVTGPSLYEQIAASIAGAQGTGAGAAARSMPPLWVDAVDIINDIDTALTAWQIGLPGHEIGTARSGAASRIADLARRPWRPQDVRTVAQITKALAGWAQDITLRLDPPKRIQLAEPCPQCDESTVYRTDSAGDTVRMAALQLDDDECVCLNCHTKWPEWQFRLLARALDWARDRREGEAERQRAAEQRIQWTGDSMARLIWTCRDCAATGDGETPEGVAAGNAHRTTCTAAELEASA